MHAFPFARRGRSTLPSLALLAALVAPACKVEQNDAAAIDDAGVVDASGEPADDGAAATDPTTPLPDAGHTISCQLDNGGDPVALCVQKWVLQQEHLGAFAAAKGIATGWDPQHFAPTAIPPGGPLYDARVTAAYAATVVRYLGRAATYGDDEIDAEIAPDALAAVPLLVAALTPAPTDPDGDLYRDLRDLAGALRVANHGTQADQLDALADAHARAFFAAAYHPLATGGAADAGTDGGGAVDGGATSGDAGADAGSTFDDGVLGDAAGGAFTYEPARAASAAFALLDMAVRHASDDGTSAAAWARAAIAVLAHLRARARDATSGLYATTLTTGDASDGASAGPFEVATTAAVALACWRANELASTAPASLPGVAAYPFGAQGDEAITAIESFSPSLWDSASGGYFAGWDAQSAALVTDKPVVASARMFGAIHRAVVSGAGNAYGPRLSALRAALTSRAPSASGFLATYPDQGAYFDDVPASFVVDGDAALLPPYSARATATVLEALDEQWVGLPP